MAGELVSFGIQKLWDLLSREHEKLQGVNDQVTDLQTDLNTLKSFLKDADTKKHTSEVVKNCIEEIEEIVFDAEDIIETFILKEELGKTGGIKKRIRRFACIIPERREIALEIGSLRERISKVIHKMILFGVERIIGNGSDPQPSTKPVEFARKYESNLVGLEANVEKLVGYLVEEDDVQVVSMTGMGGLGKTTLARQAFHHDKVKERFDRLVWVCVTQDCNLINVWQTIFRTLRPDEEENRILAMTKATLQDKLFQLLETFKSLIVFDDIWKEEDWDQIKDIFPWEKGSKVLLTSRNERVGRRGETCINFKPDFLSDQDSWTLFQIIAMPSKDSPELKDFDIEMEEIGRKIIKHCRGLPLAVRVLGGSLAAKYTLGDWNRVSKNIGPYLHDDNSSFNRVFSLSFEELPGYLKLSFLYLAHFQEDYEIDVENLSYFWAAEGILKYDNGETIRDVGDSYVEELVRRNMVISERDNTTLRFETCRLHDVMREICISKAKEENFVQIVGIRSPTAHSQSSRRFVSHNPTKLDVEREVNNSKVRSLVVVVRKNWRQRKDFWWWKLSSIDFSKLRQLRVLHLPQAQFEGGDVPDSIEKLIHLRYLNLDLADISHIPSSLRNLKLLIYLNLNKSLCYLPMPNVFKGMKELRYLALPRDVDNNTELELSDLVNLETLLNFSTGNCSLEDLRGMGKLRTLKITLTGESSIETLSASIEGLRHLENLNIYDIGATRMKEWRTLFEFNNLKELKLSTNTPLSGEIEFPSRLTSLTLYCSGFEEDPMPILEKLGHLKEVTFKRGSFGGRKMVCSRGGFPQLQKLELALLDELEEWIIEEGSMPLLHTLRIHKCQTLKKVPDGLRFIYSLKHLHVYDRWEERMSEGGKDYYKVQHIPSVTFV